jgi:hypothetical protein
VNLVVAYLRELTRAVVDGWNRFWFTPADVASLALMRICAGAMLFYTHLVWTMELDAFFGPDGFIPVASAESFYAWIGSSRSYAPSYLWYVESPTTLWASHIAGLVVLALFTLGLFTRVTSILSFVVALSYVNRVPGALFGLDQINVMLVTYLMLAPCGTAYSLDRWLAARKAGGRLAPAPPTVMANVATRLVQVHMCIIYFFAGLGKLQGETWWHGDALWGAVANLEYQTLNLTWLADWPLLTAILTQVTAYWELTFPALVWPRLLRPIVLFIAIPLHLGIGFGLGLMTFGLVMPIALIAFVSPQLVRRLLGESPTAAASPDACGFAAAPPGEAPSRSERRAS